MKARYIEVNHNNIAGFFHIPHFGEQAGGFQRPLDKARVDEMAGNFAGGIVCPDILVADVGDRHVVIDGQHRLAARKVLKFPLTAKVIKATMEEAAHQFVVLNSTGRRVPLGLRLKVAQDDASKAIRDMAKNIGCPELFAYRAVLGASGKTWLPLGAEVEKPALALAAFVAFLWTGWGKSKKMPALYYRPAVIQAVCSLVRGMSESRAAPIIKRIRTRVNFGKNGGLASRYGTSATSQKFMRNYFMNIAWKHEY